ncbi:MAG TPA: DUF2807 domain-containing protein, partial [Bacteroidales bacterium]|nr:DUF2807 domain-containing protein [Bacteroidales bacterium]
MKIQHPLCLFLLLSLIHSSTILPAQDKIMQRHTKVTDFSSVMLNGDLVVELLMADVPSVTIIGPEVDLKKVDVNMDAGSLIVSLTEARTSDSVMRVEVRTRRLMKVKASGGVILGTPEPLAADALMIDLAGEASAAMDVRSMRVSVRLDNSADLTLNGSFAVLLGEMAGQAHLKAASVPCMRADLAMT